jgi:hypothetical protein
VKIVVKNIVIEDVDVVQVQQAVAMRSIMNESREEEEEEPSVRVVVVRIESLVRR